MIGEELIRNIGCIREIESQHWYVLPHIYLKGPLSTELLKDLRISKVFCFVDLIFLAYIIITLAYGSLHRHFVFPLQKCLNSCPPLVHTDFRYVCFPIKYFKLANQ